MQIGFVGLGQMGFKMATNLLRQFPTLLCYDKNADIIPKGLFMCDSISELKEKCDLVILMLPNDEVVKEVTSELAGGRIRKIIDCSTINPKSTQKLHKALLKQGIDYLDAPVSGGVAAAADASLTFMLGSDSVKKEGVGSILRAMGTKTVACGGRGLGHLAKIANNLILGVTMITVSEAFDIAVKGGLAAKSFNEIVKNSSGMSWVTEKYLPLPGILPKQTPADRNYEPGFSVSLMTKDLSIAKALSKKSHQLTRLSQKIYNQLSHKCPSKDFSIIYDTFAAKK